MMTCQIVVMMSDGHMTRERALLDCASSTLFIMEHWAQQLQLSCQSQRLRVAGIGGPVHKLSLCSVVALTVGNEKSVKVGRLLGHQWKVEAAVLPKITSKLPASPVSLDRHWRHLSCLRLADLEFGVPGKINVLVHVGVDLLSRVVHQGRQQGPPVSPVVLKTCFGWVLSRISKHNGCQCQEVSCVLTVLASDEKLKNLSETRNMTERQFHSSESSSQSMRKFTDLQKPCP